VQINVSRYCRVLCRVRRGVCRADGRFGLLQLLHAPPCATCYQQQYVPPQYRSVQETVMVSPGSVVAHRTPAQYQTVMVPQTVMVAPPGVSYEQIPPQYATRERVEMVSPGYSYYTAVAPRCASCGY
jgi:hypothetical protein